MYHSFLIHSSADGHLGCFHVLAIVNSAGRRILNHWIAREIQVLLFYIFLLLFFFWPHRAAGGISVPRPGSELVLSAVEVWSLNHWTEREINVYHSVPSDLLGH